MKLAVFRKTRGKRKNSGLKSRIVGRTTTGRIVRGAAAGGLVLGAAALVHRSKKPFTPRADRAPNPYRYDQPGRAAYGKKSSIIQDRNWFEKRKLGSSGHAPSRETAGRSGIPAQRGNDILQYYNLDQVNRRRKQRRLNRLPPARMSSSSYSLAKFKRSRSLQTRQRISQALRGKKRRKNHLGRALSVAARTGAAGLGVGALAGRYKASADTAKVEREYAKQLGDLDKQIQQVRQNLNKMPRATRQQRLSVGEPEKERQRMINRKIRKNNRRYDEISQRIDDVVGQGEKLSQEDRAYVSNLRRVQKGINYQNRRYRDRKGRLADRVQRLQRDAKGAAPNPASANQHRNSVQAQLRDLQDQRRIAGNESKVAIGVAKQAGKDKVLRAALIGTGVGAGLGAVAYGVNRVRKQQKKRNRRKRR